MANVSNFSAVTPGASVSGTLTDKQVVQPQVPAGLRADGPRVTFHFAGEWDAGNTYVYYDVVKDTSGASWICKYPQVTVGTPLEEGAYWTRWADPNIEVEELYQTVNNWIAQFKVFVTPIMFGAKGDGITDDTQAISDCLKAGLPVNLAGKTYAIKTIAISNKATLINGNIKALTKVDTLITFKEDVSLYSVNFDGSYLTNCICDFDNVNALILNCVFEHNSLNVDSTNFPLNSCVMARSLNFEFLDSSVSNNYSHGLRLIANNAESTAYIANSSFCNNNYNTFNIQAIGLVNYNRDNGKLYNSVNIVNCYAAKNGATGIAPHCIVNVNVTNCVSLNNNEHGFAVQDGHGATFTNCKAIQNASSGFRVQGDFAASTSTRGYECCVINGNYVEGNGVSLGENIKNVVITNNIFKNISDNYGVYTQFSSKITSFVMDEITIANNEFIGYEDIKKINAFININSGDFPPFYFRERKQGIFKKFKVNHYGNAAKNTKVLHLKDFNIANNAVVNGNTIIKGDNNLCAFKTIENYVYKYITIGFEILEDCDNVNGLSLGVRVRDKNTPSTFLGNYSVMANYRKGNTYAITYELTDEQIAKGSNVDCVIYLGNAQSASIGNIYFAQSDSEFML